MWSLKMDPFSKMSYSNVACDGSYGCCCLFLVKNGKNLVWPEDQGKSLTLFDWCTRPSLGYGITKALCEDSGARDLFYSPFLECDVLFPSQLQVLSMGRDTGLPNLFWEQLQRYTEHSLMIPTTTSALEAVVIESDCLTSIIVKQIKPVERMARHLWF